MTAFVGRDRIAIYRESSDPSEASPRYVVYLQHIPAEIVDTSGGETLRGRQIEATTQSVIRFPLSKQTATVTATDQIRGESFPYEDVVFSIINLSNRRWNGEPPMVEADCARAG